MISNFALTQLQETGEVRLLGRARELTAEDVQAEVASTLGFVPLVETNKQGTMTVRRPA